MKNNTFNQVINANLASIDPGFGQFALAKASSPGRTAPGPTPPPPFFSKP